MWKLFSILENIQTYFRHFLISFYWHKVSYCTTHWKIWRMVTTKLFSFLVRLYRCPELVKRQVFPKSFGRGLFQGNLSNCEFYRFNLTSAIFLNLMTSFSNFSRRGCFRQIDLINLKKAQRVRRFSLHIKLLI